MQDLKVAIVQSDIAWEDPVANLRSFEKKLDSLTEAVDLIVLPEMFTTGFTMNAPEWADGMDGAGPRWMQKMAARKNAVLMGSLIIRENNRCFNRSFCVYPDKKTVYYDKRHLFRMAGEHNIYSSGKIKRIVDVKGWRLALFVCYDLRFPVWSRCVNREYDALIYVANWPQSRASHWQLLLKARAVENQAYCIGVNRVGVDGLGIDYRGESLVVDPLGKEIVNAGNGESIQTAILSGPRITHFREKFPAWMDSDLFKIEE